MTYTQPEGQLYFCRTVSSSSEFCFLTEENMYEGNIVAEVDSVVDYFERKVKEARLPMPEKVEVFLALRDNKISEDGWFYYCVDPTQRCLFWLDEVDLTWMADSVGSVPEDAFLSTFSSNQYSSLPPLTSWFVIEEYGMDYEYWIHVEHFPFHQELPLSLIDDLMGVVIHAAVGMSPIQ